MFRVSGVGGFGSIRRHYLGWALRIETLRFGFGFLGFRVVRL